MKLSKKSSKSSLFSGRKGKIVIQKTNLSQRKARASNVVAARAALKGKTRQSSPMSATTPPSVTSVSSGTRSTSGMSSLTQESTRYKKHGVSFDDFIEGNKDWRSFGSITYEGMKENGYVDILLKKVSIYKSAKTNKAKHKAVICSSELPLSEVASGLLQTKMRVVVLILDGIAKDPCGGVMKLSEDIGYYNEVDPILVRQWALTFIQNGGTFNNHSYKKREPAGVITDPAARGDMKRWMMLASRAKPPATAKDFMGFVNAEYNTNIKERTAQIWLHLLGFKWRGAQSLEIYNDGQQRQDVKDYTQCYCIDMLDTRLGE
jgi:hypothetical protein